MTDQLTENVTFKHFLKEEYLLKLTILKLYRLKKSNFLQETLIHTLSLSYSHTHINILYIVIGILKNPILYNK